MLLVAQGRRDHNDAAVFGDDPAFRLAASDRAGTPPLGGRGAVASQPTLSRLVSALSGNRNMGVLRAGLARFAGWRLRAMNGGRLPKRLVIDIDSLPVEVHGGQRMERPLPRTDLPSADRLGGRDGRSGRRPAPQRAGAQGRRRARLHHRGPGPGGAAPVQEAAGALRRRVSGRGADVGARGPGHALRRPDPQQRGAEASGLPAVDALASEALDRLEDSDRRGTWSCELDEEYRAGAVVVAQAQRATIAGRPSGSGGRAQTP